MGNVKIYKIINESSNDVYIGQTERSLEDRFKEHNNDNNKCKSKIVCNGLNPSIHLLYEGPLFNDSGFNMERDFINVFSKNKKYNLVNKNKPKHKSFVKNWNIKIDDDDIFTSSDDDNISISSLSSIEDNNKKTEREIRKEKQMEQLKKLKNKIELKKQNNNDKPMHYNNKIEPRDYITANNLDFNEGNIIKYISRYKQKNGLEDLLKAQNYLNYLIKINQPNIPP